MSRVANLKALLAGTLLIAAACFVLLRLQNGFANSTEATAVTPTKPAESWWIARHEEKLNELADRQAVDVVMIGDSITHFWERFGKDVWNEFYGHRNAVNLVVASFSVAMLSYHALEMPLVDVTEFVLREVLRRLQGWQAPGVPFFHYRRGLARIRYE